MPPEGRAPRVRQGGPWARGGPRRLDGVRVMARVGQPARRAVRRSPDFGCRNSDQRGSRVSGHKALRPSFPFSDEFYLPKDLDRSKVHVLLRLDVTPDDARVPGGDYPLAWRTCTAKAAFSSALSGTRASRG